MLRAGLGGHPVELGSELPSARRRDSERSHQHGQAGSVVRGARRWATLSQAAAYLNCHPKTISRRLTDGTLSRYRIGRRLLVDLDEVDAVLETTSYRAPHAHRLRRGGIDRFKSCQPDKVFVLVITALIDLDGGRVPDTCQIRVLCERKVAHRVLVHRDSRQRDCGPDRVREPLPCLPRRSSQGGRPIGP